MTSTYQVTQLLGRIRELEADASQARVSLHDQVAIAALQGMMANPNLEYGYGDYVSKAFITADKYMHQRQQRTTTQVKE